MRLLIRADATVEMGTGHVMRSIALGQAWQDVGGTVEFLTECDSDTLVERLRVERFSVRRLSPGSEWETFQAVCSEITPVAVVLDGYHFRGEYQERVRQCVRPLVVIDDLAHLPCYRADLIVNQNVYAEELNYHCEPYTRVLLGCQWALLRREFHRWQGWRRQIPETARKVLIALGGSDPANITPGLTSVVRAVLPENVEISVVAGGGNPHFNSLRDTMRELPGVELRCNVSDMPALMAWADVAVTAAGSTCWEMAFMGLPFLTVIVADNQERVAKSLDSSGVAMNLGWHNLTSPETIALAVNAMARSKRCRERFSRAGRRLVPGGGTEAVVAAIRELI